MSRGPHQGFFADEQGARSMGRALLVITTGYILFLISAQTFKGYAVSGAAWTLLSSMEGAFTIWVAGARIAQYLVPAVTAGIRAVRDAVAGRRVDGETEQTP
jgi:hypothetical protein